MDSDCLNRRRAGVQKSGAHRGLDETSKNPFPRNTGCTGSLPFYAGGLGFLAADFIKECSDLNIPMAAVGFMYPEGYLHQRIRDDGWQDNIDEPFDREAAAISRVIQLAQYLVHGVDLWLNNPLPPMEASGTSGMKSAINRVPQLSILDGWWIEGYNGKNGWAFGGPTSESNRDGIDADAIYRMLENEIVPLYYRI